MNCSSCGTPLSSDPEVLYCSTCGAPTHNSFSGSGSSPNDATAASSASAAALNEPMMAMYPYDDASPQAPPPPPPPTLYGSMPYGTSTYDPVNPYDVPGQTHNPVRPTAVPPPVPLPPQRRRRRVKLGVLIGTVVLVLAVVGVGIFALFIQGAKNKSPSSTVNSSQNTQATATALANTVITSYPPPGAKLVLDDPLSDNTKGYNWDRSSDTYGACAFTGAAYHVMTKAGYFRVCTAGNTDFTNFAYEVQMTISKGDCGGIFFLAQSANTHYYFFRVCQDGSYSLFIFLGPNGSSAASQNRSLIYGQAVSEINAGLKQVNVIAVVVQSGTIYLYVNHQEIDSTSDSTYNRGQVAVGADGFPQEHDTEVIYSNAKVWQF